MTHYDYAPPLINIRHGKRRTYCTDMRLLYKALIGGRVSFGAKNQTNTMTMWSKYIPALCTITWLKQACKLDRYLRNLKLSLTDPLTD